MVTTVVCAFLLAPLAGAQSAFVEVPSDAPSATECRQEENEVPDVAGRYLELVFQRRDLEATRALLDPDVLFIDPTADVWNRPLSRGIRGREALLEEQRSFGVREVDFQVTLEFQSGEHAAFAGLLDYESARGKVRNLPFVTILHIQKGRIVERRDYGDYDRLLERSPAGRRDEARLERTARAYLEAYSRRSYCDLAGLLSEEATFQDPTAIVMGGGREVCGRDAILGVFEAGLEQLAQFEIEAPFAFFSNHHAVFAGLCRYALPGTLFGLKDEPVEFSQGLIMALTLADGEVTGHLDYSDYGAYWKRVRELREPGARSPDGR